MSFNSIMSFYFGEFLVPISFLPYISEVVCFLEGHMSEVLERYGSKAFAANK